MTPRRLQAELVLDAGAELGEGPLWDHDRGILIFVDIHQRRVHIFDPSDGGHRVFEMDRPVTALGLTSRGDWIAAAGAGFARLDPDGRLQPIVEVEPASRRTRMNDGAVDPAGRFWAGTMSLDGVEGQGTLYRLDPDGRVTPVISPITTSNGPAWSPDGRLMYYVDTRTRRVDVLDFDAATGEAGNRRVFVDFTGAEGRPDGVIVDAEGGVWVGLWLGHAVHRYTPDGRLDTIVEVPAACATKCAFGGADLTDLYITTARAPLDEAGRRAQPTAGGLFHVRPGVRGLPAVPYRG